MRILYITAFKSCEKVNIVSFSEKDISKLHFWFVLIKNFFEFYEVIELRKNTSVIFLYLFVERVMFSCWLNF